MGLLDNTSQVNYYTGDDFGGYQFTSLEDIINQFMVVYVGEEKVISKANRIDVAFHAQRALAELSFDTFKSIKSQEITLPPSNTMILPHDYVNYTRVMWSDGNGIKYPIYPTKDTQNPFAIKQEEDGSYFFGVESERLSNYDFSDGLSGTWNVSVPGNSHAWDGVTLNNAGTKNYFSYVVDTIEISNGELCFGHLWNNGFGVVGGSRSYGAWQRIDVSLDSIMDLTASATSAAKLTDAGGTDICDTGIVRVGVTTTDPSVGWEIANGNTVTGMHHASFSASYPSPNYNSQDYMDLGYVEWNDGSSSQKEILDIDVSSYDEVWVWTTSTSPWLAAGITSVSTGAQGSLVATDPISPTTAVNLTHQVNKVDQISVIIPGNIQTLSNTNVDGNSSTWNNYKASNDSSNNAVIINNAQDVDIYDSNAGQRYGISPQQAQSNGSFYVDNLRGLINFSSNISGKTVILDYISDSLGTDGEMQVHKFAEEAIYKWIAHGILSTKIGIPEYVVQRWKKEKFAATRQAKLRLSNIKLEELTQVLRGKSKHIKH
jgi:hypothetical protein